MKTTNIIMGFFWRGEVFQTHLTKFLGEIEIAVDGTFIGYTKDSYGRATIKGQVKGALLEFTKDYEPESRGAKGLIYYLLRGHSYGDASVMVCGGWKGVYKLNGDQIDSEEDGSGQAACLIYPC